MTLVPRSLRDYPATLTSYDVWKTLALLTMVADHIGAYFFPELPVWRAVGRLSAPVWLFLIGYARTRDIPMLMAAGAAMLIVATFVFGGSVFPVNILVPMMAIRLVLTPLAAWSFKNAERLLITFAVLLALCVPTYFVWDYGTLCVMIALYGQMVRQRGSVSAPTIIVWGAASAAAYCAMIWLFFAFETLPQNIIAMGGTVALFAALYYFRPVMDIAQARTWPRPVRALMQTGGRHTLPLYVGHLLLFAAIACVLGLSEHGWLAWTWY